VAFLSAWEDEPLNNRYNDGKCDPCGRLLAGMMGEKEAELEICIRQFVFPIHSAGQMT
jgi:sugar lactone lactonase YvrE